MKDEKYKHQTNWVERQKSKGLKRRLFWTTEEEANSLRRYLRALRTPVQVGGADR